MTMPICPIVASRGRPALVLSIDNGLINLNQRIVHKIDKTVHVTICVAKPIQGKSQYKILTIIAAIPNQMAAKVGTTSSISLKATTKTTQCQGSNTICISRLYLLVLFAKTASSTNVADDAAKEYVC